MAHNAETNRYRGLSTKQREGFLDGLNAGLSPDDAAEQVGVTVSSLAVAAAYDGQLRAALNGQPVAVQRAARKGDLLAALTRTGGIMQDALLLVGIDKGEVEAWRKEDPQYASAEDAVMRWLASVRPANRQRSRLTDEELDRAAALLEEGAAVEAAARAVNVTGTGLRYASARHARLAAALPPLRESKSRGRASKMTPRVEGEVRRMWADPDLSKAAIARQLDVRPETLSRWAARLGLSFDRAGA
ncbi:hypothetical protein ACFVY4_26745 [Streptomyces sp. NPDC058299]|uniref:hypothetical protein n=1 Tax=Streptomyces sp. NPDC058299 TaxID=3346435 RepID=UPI0036E5CF3A